MTGALARIPIYAATLVAVVLLWWGYVRFAGIPPYVLPPPGAVWSEIATLFRTGRIWPHLGHTVGVLAAGLGIGGAAGLGLGILLAKMPRVERAVRSYLFFFQTAPKIALAPLFILWFGLGLTSKIVLVVSLVFFPIVVGTLLGLRSVSPQLIELSRLLRLSPARRLIRVEMPSAMPEIFAGLKVAAVQGTIGAILSEWMSGGVGLGYLMVFAGTTYRSPLLFAMVVLTALLGIAVYQAVAVTERRVLSWR